jgi:hypothetical protein
MLRMRATACAVFAVLHTLRMQPFILSLIVIPLLTRFAGEDNLVPGHT